MDSVAFGDDFASVDGAAGLVEGVSKDGEKDYRGNDTLEREEVLHLFNVSIKDEETDGMDRP